MRTTCRLLIANVCVLFCLHGSHSPAAPPPNIVLILADDLGWRDLGCCGSTFYETPAIDGLAAQGMRFDQAYAAANVCSPTRASIMTGKYPARLHTTNFFGGNRRGKLLPPQYRQSLPPEEISLAKAFGQAGYRTWFGGKWHLGGQGSQPQDHGFEVVTGLDTRPGRGPDDDPHFSARLSTEVAEFIANPAKRPFFLYLPLHSVHIPLRTRPDLQKKYGAKAAALPPKTPRQVPIKDFMARAVQDHPVYAGMVQESSTGWSSSSRTSTSNSTTWPLTAEKIATWPPINLSGSRK